MSFPVLRSSNPLPFIFVLVHKVSLSRRFAPPSSLFCYSISFESSPSFCTDHPFPLFKSLLSVSSHLPITILLYQGFYLQSSVFLPPSSLSRVSLFLKRSHSLFFFLSLTCSPFFRLFRNPLFLIWFFPASSSLSFPLNKVFFPLGRSCFCSSIGRSYSFLPFF